MIAFSTFLIGCVDYSRIKPEKSTRLSDVVVHQCVSKCVPSLTLRPARSLTCHRFSGFTLLFFMLFTAFYVWQIVMFVLGVRRLVDMYHFYTHLLKIPDVRVHHLKLLSLAKFNPVRHPNHPLVRSRPPHRSNPGPKPRNRHLIQHKRLRRIRHASF